MKENNPTDSELGRSSRRLEYAMKANTALVAKVTEVKGKENILKIPDRKNPVIAVSHMGSDTMFQAAAGVLSDSFDIGFAAHETKGFDVGFRFMLDHLLDMKLYDISAKLKKGGVKRYTFNPHDYDAMLSAMRDGKTILTAGHPPTEDGTLPSYGGISSIYLAQKSGEGVILPVLIDFHTNEHVGKMNDIGKTIVTLVKRKRPHTSIIIGEPIQLAPIPEKDLALFDNYYLSPKNSMTPEEEVVARSVHQRMKEQANMIMEFYASHLPPERRGRFGGNSITIE